ncbi:3'-5' exonuclease [uncultured Methanobrevibacter sp.]|uniref:3'-5' exonuclease n=1 Tax=uncultured Methanobrevibacter sp. TaxID=253161 RepID=UPI0025E0B0A6|nr:ATP-dependent helicase [uncultured Methanobrevibacter sp.]
MIDDPEELDKLSPEELAENERNRELKKYQSYWDNSILLQTIKAYPEYLRILKEYKFLDYGILQTDVLAFLEKKNPNTQYKNVLVDEFQDTDPIQYRIFEILLKEIIKENKSHPNEITSTFTVVGDIDQSIYRFRGAYEDYFASLESLDFTDVEKIFLDVNYRSTKEIIRFSDNYIKHQRDRIELKPNEKKIKSREIYYLENADRDDEAANITEIVLKLKKEGIIREYKDIAILFKSVTQDSKKVRKAFDETNIPYQVSEMKELEKRDEIKFILTMMNFIIDRESDYIPVIADNKLPWLRLTGFNDDSKAIFKISDDTKDKLKEYHKEFEKEVVKNGKAAYEEVHDEKSPNVRAISGVLKFDEEVLINTFKEVDIPLLTNEELDELEITNEKDLKFFRQLNEIKDNIFNQDYEDRYTILEIYYKLLEIAGYLNYEFVSDESNADVIDNLALLSNIIYDYEETVSRKNIFGLYFYLVSNMRHIGKDSTSKTRVNLMTVHKAKGLEFPVVIIAGLNDNKFPKDYNYLAKKSPEIFNIPNDCLEYKNETEDEELLNHNKEEERVLYVAMTRAEDLLILSKDVDVNMRKKDIISIFDEELEELNSLEPTEDVINEINSLEENKRLTIEHKKRLNNLIDNSDCVIKIDAEEMDQLDFKPPIKSKKRMMERKPFCI